MNELIPPNHMIDLIGGGGAEGYQATGRDFLEIFIKYAGLTHRHKILEVGSGCGRMALPLTYHLTTGFFDGFDIMPDMVQWCQENITARWPNFRFQHADVFNSVYNPAGRIEAKDYRFPYEDSSFDIIFLTSVFTHMLPDDLAHYTREIARTLKPDGTVAITFFILNDESLAFQQTPGSQLKIEHPYADGQVFVRELDRPEAAVGYPQQLVERLLRENGLKLEEPIYFGSWCGRKNCVTFQDLTILKKARVTQEAEVRSVASA